MMHSVLHMPAMMSIYVSDTFDGFETDEGFVVQVVTRFLGRLHNPAVLPFICSRSTDQATLPLSLRSSLGSQGGVTSRMRAPARMFTLSSIVGSTSGSQRDKEITRRWGHPRHLLLYRFLSPAEAASASSSSFCRSICSAAALSALSSSENGVSLSRSSLSAKLSTSM